jgi:biopolymer transport protein ExbD
MRIPSPFRDRRQGVELQLTPMIDCVFLLMIYFLWSSSFAVAEMSMSSKLSPSLSDSGAGNTTQPPPADADFPNVVVRVLWNGVAPIWTVNEIPVGSLAELRQQLTVIARIKQDAPIILDPASDVPLGDVIDVFDLSRVVGFQKVQFAASADGRSRENANNK